MTDILGPMDAANSVTVRPGDERTPTGSDTFFKNCSSSTAVDGTKIGAGWLNQVSAALRALARGNGLKLDGVTNVLAEDNTNDALLLQSVQHLIQRGKVNFSGDTGTANAAIISVNPAAPEVITGMRFWVWKCASSNTGAMTCNGAPLAWADGSPLVAGDWPASTPAELISSGTTYALLSVMGPRVFARASASKNLVQYTSAGTFSWTCPAGVYWVFVRVCGGGASGAAGTTSISGGGGGAGGYAEGWVSVTPGNSYTIVVGAGGASQSSSGSGGLAGSSSSFGAAISAPGAPSAFTTLSTGSVGGSAGTGGQLNIQGAPGGDGVSSSSILGGGGGPSPFGGGGGRTGAPTGVAGSTPGAGGGGSYGPSAGASGAGAPGGVTISY